MLTVHPPYYSISHRGSTATGTDRTLAPFPRRRTLAGTPFLGYAGQLGLVGFFGCATSGLCVSGHFTEGLFGGCSAR
jgi:hypothetical protein